MSCIHIRIEEVEQEDLSLSDAAQDGTCPARAVVPSGHGTTARAMKKN
jgi:hypothetical protein